MKTEETLTKVKEHAEKIKETIEEYRYDCDSCGTKEELREFDRVFVDENIEAIVDVIMYVDTVLGGE